MREVRYEVIHDPDQPDTVPRFIIRDRAGIMPNAERFCGSFTGVTRARAVCELLNQATYADQKIVGLADKIDQNKKYSHEMYAKQEAKHRKKIKKLKAKLSVASVSNSLLSVACHNRQVEIISDLEETNALQDDDICNKQVKIEDLSDEIKKLEREALSNRERIAQMAGVIDERGIPERDSLVRDNEMLVNENLELLKEMQKLKTRLHNMVQDTTKERVLRDNVYQVALELNELLEIEHDG
jgi:hypothetical protein